MIIYIWEVDGKYRWGYSWLLDKPRGAKSVDLDVWFQYDLNEQEVLCCLDAIEQAGE